MTQLEQAWESVATHDELRAKYATRWPAMRRRFRVEGSRCGNSRLLMRSMAADAARRYGGKLIEVFELTPLAARQAADLPKCSYCDVAEGKPCVSSSGGVRVPHAIRWADAA